MVLLSRPETSDIDAAVDVAFARLRDRMAGHGDGFEFLSAAMQRALTGGKRLRPALVVGAYRTLAGDGPSSAAVPDVAAAFELLHAGFVMHDDVIDHDVLRRGVPNVGGEFRARAAMRGAASSDSADVGDAAGILAGDLLLHEAHRIVARAAVADATRLRLLDLLDDAVVVSAAGELADVEHAALPDAPDLDQALSATRDKTAVYSFSAPLRAGAALASAPADVDEALGRCGNHLGVAFQLVDDLIGAFGDSAQAGREEGVDLVSAKRTPIVAFARRTPRWSRVNDALALAHTGPLALRAAQRELTESGAAEQTRTLVDGELGDAVRSVDTLPPDLREFVSDLAGYVKRRMP